MIATAKLNFVRLSARKTRLVADLVRGKRATEALDMLDDIKKRASKHIADLIKSAIANAKVKDKHLDESLLYIAKLTVDGGPMLARYRAASMGRASMIRHRTSHITVELGQKVRRVPVTPEQTKQAKQPLAKKGVLPVVKKGKTPKVSKGGTK